MSGSQTNLSSGKQVKGGDGEDTRSRGTTASGQSGSTASGQSGKKGGRRNRKKKRTKRTQMEAPRMEEQEESDTGTMHDCFETFGDMFWDELGELMLENKRLKNLARGAPVLEGMEELQRAIRAEQEVRKLGRRVGDLESQNKHLESQNKHLESQNKDLLRRIRHLEVENDEMRGTITSLNTTLSSVQKELTTVQNYARYGDYCTRVFAHAAHHAKLAPYAFKDALDGEIDSRTTSRWIQPHHVKLDKYLRVINLSRVQWETCSWFGNGRNICFHGESDDVVAIRKDLTAVNLLAGVDDGTKNMLRAVISAYMNCKMWKTIPPSG